MFAKDAIILDALHTCGACASHGLVMNDFVLQPEIRNGEAYHVIDYSRHMLGCAKYIGEIDARAGLAFGRNLRGFKVGITGKTENLAECRIDGDHAIAVVMQIAADVVTGSP